jgi:hypothetical protein
MQGGSQQLTLVVTLDGLCVEVAFSGAAMQRAVRGGVSPNVRTTHNRPDNAEGTSSWNSVKVPAAHR